MPARTRNRANVALAANVRISREGREGREGGEEERLNRSNIEWKELASHGVYLPLPPPDPSRRPKSCKHWCFLRFDPSRGTGH
jgi:hypothetical protein